MTQTASSGRAQIPHESGESQGICVIPIRDQERAEDDVSDSRELQLDTPTEIRIWTVILSFKNSVELFFQYLRYTLRAFVRKHDVGSLLITVECSSLQILEGLWEDYRCGHLNAIAQEILVTAEVLEKLGFDDVRLKTFISEEEYEKGKQIFMDHSGKCVLQLYCSSQLTVRSGVFLLVTLKNLHCYSKESKLKLSKKRKLLSKLSTNFLRLLMLLLRV